MSDLIRPMLASPSTSAGNRTPIGLRTLVGTHAFDLKLDGLRAILYWDGKRVRLVNRSLVDITRQFPELDKVDLGPAPLVVDGELVADDGTFTTVATRGKQSKAAAIAQHVFAHPCRFVAFDVLKVNDVDVMRIRWQDRRAALEKLAADWPAVMQVSVCSDDGPGMWEHVAALGMEGLIAKRKDGVYLPGHRGSSWIKFKVTRRITCVAMGYEAGEGSRIAFGAMHLGLIGPDGPVIIGRVGTGFKAADIRECKARLDRKDYFLVEIEALNRTAAGILRFPVYKGIRTDLPLTEATLDQLATLPLC